MQINDINSFSISFTPDKKGTFIARYVLENDFKERKILSNNINDYKYINESRWYSITITVQLPQVAELSLYVPATRHATSLTQMILLPVKFPYNYPHK
jgi:hypothetical protein